MTQQRLLRAVGQAGDRVLRLRTWRWRTACWLGLAVLACAMILARHSFGAEITTNAMIGVLAVGVVVSFLLQALLLRRKPGIQTARQIEATHPDLNDALLAAMEQQPEEPGGQLRYLQNQVIDKAITHSTFRSWQTIVPNGQMRRWIAAGITSLVVFLSCTIFAFDTPATALLGPAAPSASASPDGTIYGIVVEPGDTEIERGTSLLVMARFEGQLPSETSLDLTLANGDTERFQMAPGVDSNLFLARVPSVTESGTYQIQYDDEQTSAFNVTVFTVPALEQADAKITYPSYTDIEEKVVQDTRRISVVQGSTVEWMFRLNKEVATAELREADGTVVELDAIEGAAVQGTKLLADKSRKFTLHLKDSDGRENRFPPDITLSVVENRRPDLKLAFPGKDRPVSPLEEMAIEAKVSDDYGLDSFGLIYSLVGQDEQEVKLGEQAPPRTKHSASHVLSLESMKAEPDQLVSYYFYADDRGPDGEIRRTLSDMYFAEVRKFDEIYRQGREQPGGQQGQQGGQQGQQGQQQGQQGQKLEQVGQLQKQIMTATWNLARRPSLNSRDSDGIAKAKDDAKVLSASQETARTQVQELAGEMQEPEMQAIAADLVSEMAAAVESLNAFDSDGSADTLKEALKLEQRAYQRILQLRAKEFEVQRQQQQRQQGQQGQQANSRSQQQMQQLELKNQENRYQAQRQAQQQQQQATVDQEQLRTLNRLRELARRQEAINEKLKQLESELRQAKTEEEREEIERQLKRLRDEQQQMLRDIDETAEDIDKQRENLDQSAQMQQQAQQARENALRTSEALKENELSKAITEGTRTERELKDLRDDFRKQTANEFEDAMRQMRQEARDVEEQQKEIGKQLAENAESKSLRYSEKRKDIEEQLQSQAERVTDLSQKMREIVKQSEDTEPLLARTLYDAARELKDNPPEKDLEAERFLVGRGFMDQAREADRQALKSIEQLREGIEKSAETVLGNELDGLRRAQEEMDRLQRQLQDELARNMPGQSSEQGERRERQDDTSNDDPRRNGERQSTEPRDGERQQGEGQNGQPREGERQQEPREREGQAGDRGQGQREGQQREGQRREGESQQEGQPGRGQDGQPREGEPREQQGQRGQRGQQEGQRGQQEGQQQQQQQQQGQGQGQGQRQEGQQPREGNGGDGERNPQDGRRSGQQLDARRGGLRNIGREEDGGLNGGNPQYAPLTGNEYREWTDGLRDIEEMLDDPELRSDVARIRDRARAVRVDLKRHSKEPQWDLVRDEIMRPMLQLQNRIREEIAKRDSKDSLVPIDRDPVPNRYAEMVRRYYEELGRTEDRPQPPANRKQGASNAPAGANR